MIVTLTQADIDRSRPGDCFGDAIATALLRITGKRWKVDPPFAYPEAQKPYTLPKAAIQLIQAQDNDQPIRPITFELK